MPYQPPVVPSGLQNGVNAVYTLPQSPNPSSSLFLTFNGSVLASAIDYTLSGSTVTLLSLRPNAGSSPPDVFLASFEYGATPPAPIYPGSPSFWGKLVNFEAALRKPLLIPFGLFSPQDNLGFIASISQSSELTTITIGYSAALIVDMSYADVITVHLTGNVSSMTLVYSGTAQIAPGQRNWIRLVQDSTGGRTVVLPTNLNYDTGFAVDPGANRATVLPIQWDGFHWIFFASAFSVPVA